MQIKSTKFLLSVVIETPKNTPKGLVLFLPGYLDSKDYQSFREFSKTAVKCGYIGARFDPTGTWESGGTIADYSITQYIKDIEAIVAHMQKKHGKFSKIILCGHSLGGHVAINYAAKHKEITAVIAIMPPQSVVRKENQHERMVEWKENKFDDSRRDTPNDSTKKINFNVPHSYVLDSLNYNALKAVKEINILIVLITGKLDKVISPESVEEIYNAANEPKKFVLLENIGHDFRRKEKDTKIVAKEIEKILKKQ